MDRWQGVESFGRNLKQTFRRLWKSPGFTAISVLILALGIGSSVAAFRLLDALLFRPLPVEKPGQLVRIDAIGRIGKFGGLPSTIVNPLKGIPGFAGFCGYGEHSFPVEINRNLQQLGAFLVMGGCFHTLGLHVQLGRAIAPENDHWGTEPVAVLTDWFWHSAYDGRPDVLGKQIRINNRAYTIIGVAQKQFSGLTLGFRAGIILPLQQEASDLPGGRRPTVYHLNLLARRSPNVSDRQLQIRVTASEHHLLEASVPSFYSPEQRKQYLSSKLVVTSARTGIDYWIRHRFGKPLYATFGICAAILLIGWMNIVNLLLARNVSRQQEVAVRLALGATRRSLAVLLGLEATILTLAGSAIGVAIAVWVDRLLLAEFAAQFRVHLSAGFDRSVLFFLFIVILGAFLAFWGACVWQINRLCKETVLNESGRGVVRGSAHAQKILLGGQIAGTLALVTVCSLFAASLKNLYDIHFGVHTRNVWEASLSPRPGGYRDIQRTAYYTDLLNQFRTAPGILSASLSSFIPYESPVFWDYVTNVENPIPGNKIPAREVYVSDGFLRTLGMKLIAGRDFQPGQSRSGEPSVILSESLAQHLGGVQEVLGHHIRLGDRKGYQRLLVVGVASNAQLSLADPDDHKPFLVYIDFWQHPQVQAYPTITLKTASSTLSANLVRQIVRSRGREFVETFTTLNSEKDGALTENLLLAYLSSGLSALALFMAAAGLFGLLSYQVTRRTNEIGVRMALGAERAQVQWLILRQVFALVVFGSLAGIGLSFAVGRTIAGLLYGVGPNNLWILSLSVAILIATALCAAWIPARRASSVNPLVALRHQ